MAKKEQANISIVAEANEYVVIDKPALLDSQNSKPGRSSVVDWLEHRYHFKGLVHRLDFGTSGLMICAKTAEGARLLTEALQRGGIGRTYLAVILGGGLVSPPNKNLPDTGEFSFAIEGAAARTHFKVLERFNNAALVEVDLETGRKHQIRRHFAENQTPLLGDHLYGKKGAALLFSRPALHARKLAVTLGGKKLDFQAPMPNDLNELINRLRASTATRS